MTLLTNWFPRITYTKQKCIYKCLFTIHVQVRSITDEIITIHRTSKGGSIGSTPACGPRDLSSNPTWGNIVETTLFNTEKHSGITLHL